MTMENTQPSQPAGGGTRVPMRLIHLLSSMPVAVFLLCLVALASMIGTILVQNRDQDFYISSLGPTWYKILNALDFFNMYDSWWFLLIMTLLVLSVSAALLRHGPRFWHLSRPLKAMRPWPARSDAEFSFQFSQPVNNEQLQTLCRRHGFREFMRQEEQSLLLARKGRLGRFGFFFVHGGVVLICIGGLITSQLGFRGAMNIPENDSDNIIYVQDGNDFRRLQLPFQVRNDEFNIDFYQSGMPSEYSSRLSLLQGDQVIANKRITVNDPLRYKGITFYQSSFGDAGSAVNFTLRDLTREGFPTQKVETAVGKTLEDGVGLKLTVKELRQHNVINMSEDNDRPVLRDVGPSLDILFQSPAGGNITYRIYLAYPNMLAVARAGEQEMIYDDLGFSPADSQHMGLLAAFLAQLSKLEGEITPDSRRAAFAEAMRGMNIPLEQAADYGVRIVNAEQVLRKHKLPMLFSFDSFTPKMYTGLQVARDPGSPLVWSACALLVLGLYLIIYLHEQRLWLRLSTDGRRLEVRAIHSHRDKHPLQQRLEHLRQDLTALGGVETR